MTAEGSLAKTRLLIVITTIAINMAAVGLLTLVPWSNWKTGVALNLVDNVLLFWHIA